MLTKEFALMVADGVHPVVTFGKGIDDLESYPESGMRARVVGVDLSDCDVYKLKVDYSEFDDFNKQFESANYYDKSGQATLNAREAGYYKVEDVLYVDPGIETPWVVEEADRLKVFARFKQEGVGLTYVQWLEDQVIGGSGGRA